MACGRPCPTVGSLLGRERIGQVLPVATAAGIAAGGLLHALGAPRAGDATWAAIVALSLVPLGVAVLRLLSRGDVGVDAIALVAMGGCLATLAPRRRWR
jgi:hypothetical protein